MTRKDIKTRSLKPSNIVIQKAVSSTELKTTQAHWKYVTLPTFLQNLKYVSPGTIHCTFRVKCPLEALNGFNVSPFQIEVRNQTFLVNNVLSSPCTLIFI